MVKEIWTLKAGLKKKEEGSTVTWAGTYPPLNVIRSQNGTLELMAYVQNYSAAITHGTPASYQSTPTFFKEALLAHKGSPHRYTSKHRYTGAYWYQVKKKKIICNL
jgi:hypothetical protein